MIRVGSLGTAVLTMYVISGTCVGDHPGLPTHVYPDVVCAHTCCGESFTHAASSVLDVPDSLPWSP